jgi:chemotaxis protein MotB
MADNDKKNFIIIKRISGGGHAAHHGGAWKVAYADFVTAMMAFFLLLWLLNAVPSDKLSGIAQYFEPTTGLQGQKGIGFEGGKSQNKEGISSYDKVAGIKYGVIRKGDLITAPQEGTEITTEEQENDRFNLIASELKKMIIADQELAGMQNAVEMSITPEGLEIKITDQDKYPMFKPKSAELNPYAKNILSKISRLIMYSPNYLQVGGHTDVETGIGDSSYTNWELAADMANTSRRYMIEQGINIDRFNRIVSFGDSDPIDKTNPYSPKNRRVTIVLLRNSQVGYNKLSVPSNLIADPSQNKFAEDSKAM